MRRNRFRQPLLHRIWDKIPAEYKERLQPYSWSASSHFLAIVVMFILTFPVKTNPPLVIELGYVSAMDEAELMLENLEAATPLLDPVDEIVELPPPIDLQDLTDTKVVPPTVIEGSIPSEPSESIASPTSSHSNDVESSDSRVIEVNRRVNAAGGGTIGPLRVSLMWETNDDIDLHLRYLSNAMPSRRRPFVDRGYLWFGQPATALASLDVDSQATFIVARPCENIIFKTVPKDANFSIALNLFAWRSRMPKIPYTVTVKYGEQWKVLEGTISVRDGMKQIHAFTSP